MVTFASLRSTPFQADAVVPQDRPLPFQIQTQIHDQWCWAAVSASVSRFFRPDSPWEQCVVARATLPTPGDCCVNGDTTTCNVHWELDKALETTGNLEQYISNIVVSSEIEARINVGAPVAIRIEWDGGIGHFVVIYGIRTDPDGNIFVAVGDPKYTSGEHNIADLDGNYLNGDGRWTHTYFTRG